MPPTYGYNNNTRKDLYTSTTSSGARHPQDKSTALSPVTPAVTGIDYPSPVDAPSTEADPRRFHLGLMPPNHYPHANNGLYTLPNTAGSSIDDATARAPVIAVSLDDVWSTIRQEKERKMAKEKPKVQSLEEVTPEMLLSNETQDEPSIRIPVMESHFSPPKSIKRQKSISTFRESSDGRSIVATLEMPPEIEKQDIHISFQRNRLILTWETVEMLEYEEDGVVYRERCERFNHRTLPLPDGTRFEEVQALMNGRRLVLRYPNMRCHRVEPRSRSGDS